MCCKTFETEVLIIGTGIAGLSSAIKLAENGKKIIVLSRHDKPEQTNTYWAQGGIIYSSEELNDYDIFIDDINKASANTANKYASEVLAKRSAKILKEILLDKAKASFNLNEHGELARTKEAAHSQTRIIFKGDYTGKEIEVSLLNYLNDQKRFPNVSILTSFTAIDLLTPEHHGTRMSQRYERRKVLGTYAFDQKNECVTKIIAKKTILATGGVSSIYLHNSNAGGARGDGHAMARRAGAFMSNMEFIQFHPTTLYTSSVEPRFLISEAVRGEGGILRNSMGQAFMEKYHPDCELAPRDIVARSILSEMISLKDSCVYLDITHQDGDWIQDRFPTIYKHCLKKDIDITKSPIPVVPAAHYACGGVKTDLQGQTNLPNLYAVGEVASTGLHGANRLASTSLLEGLTFGYIAAEHILETIDESRLYDPERLRDWDLAQGDTDLSLIAQDFQTIKQTMWNYVGLRRSKERLRRARSMFTELYDDINTFYRNAKLHDELIGLKNSIEVALMIINSSLHNPKSAGCFYRED